MRKDYLPIYRIKKGDTLSSISQKYGVSATEILIQNCIVPKQIKEGFWIQIKK